MVQIRFDNLCGPLFGPLLSPGMGFGFPETRPHRGSRAADWSGNDVTVNPVDLTFRWRSDGPRTVRCAL
jgi:hypothetical protein